MKKAMAQMSVAAILFTLFAATIVTAADQSVEFCTASRDGSYHATSTQSQFASPSDKDDYVGSLRVYMVEPESRWLDYNQLPYDFGFVGFSIDASFSLGSDGVYDTTVIWDTDAAGYGDITEDNIRAIAAVFDDEAHTAYSEPPSGHEFDAYYVDASAAASSGETGYNETAPGFTHTVFIDQVEVTWCPYCSREPLRNIYLSGDYKFHYAAVVTDMDMTAYIWAYNHYNLWGWPTCYIDGGHGIVVGIMGGESVIRDAIELSGLRAVPYLNLAVRTDWLGKAGVQVRVNIKSWLCGDNDASGAVDIDDVVYLLNYIFAGGPAPDPLGSGDADCSGDVDIDDVVYLIQYIFAGGPAPCDPDGDGMPDC